MPAKKFVGRDDIETLPALVKSLMPEASRNSAKQNDRSAQFSLRRKYLPLARQGGDDQYKAMFYDENSVGERLAFTDWSPKTFEGVPFQLVDPQGDKVRTRSCSRFAGNSPPTMPKTM
jgi:hypothetical protein